ncbi:MAG: aminoacyl-tRNA hydrolase [Planctomycetes bacterium]|nr:aminoacyl-tRNA hydrolase [Planctomycetota bacterium]
MAGAEPDTNKPQYLVVGLGNPGLRYAYSRHNIGFRVMDILAERWESNWNEDASGALLSQSSQKVGTDLEGEEGKQAIKIALAKPLTYMNLSGTAVAALCDNLNLMPESLLVVVDDLNLPLGQLRLRSRGSDGGHNGLASIADCLATEEYNRLRVGIGIATVPGCEDAVSHVLGAFTPAEEVQIKKAVERAADCVEDWIQRGLAYCQEVYNRQIDILDCCDKREDLS